MSDPVTNAEVEDVLSSIRRLVSEDKRPLQTERVERPSDRLVLTPSLRVSEGSIDLAEDPQTEDPQEIVDQMAEDVPQEIALSGAEDELVYDFTPRDGDSGQIEETGQTDAQSQADQPIAASSPFILTNLLDDDSEILSNLDQIEIDEIQEFETAKPEDAPQQEADIAQSYEFEDKQDDVQDDVQNVEVADMPELQEDTWEVEEGWADEQSVEDDPLEQHSPQAQDGPGATGDNVLSMAAASAALGASSGLSAKIAALETAIGGISDNFEPESASGEALAGTKQSSMTWEDTIEDHSAAELTDTNLNTFARSNENAGDAFDDATGFDANDDTVESITQGVAEPRAQTKGVEMDGIGDAFGGGEPMMDEEALRDLVSEIVRAELQGALGERITRNVRKLVRREIHRALTAQELD